MNQAENMVAALAPLVQVPSAPQSSEESEQKAAKTTDDNRDSALKHHSAFLDAEWPCSGVLRDGGLLGLHSP
jgi:hypothetical protein